MPMSRLNPLQPEDGKRTVHLETENSHQTLEERKVRGKRAAYMQRNQTYVKAMYGNPVEKEQVRQKHRAALQGQITELDNKHRHFLDTRYKESDFAIQYDQACMQQDRQDDKRKKEYLTQFRNHNKMLMEERAEERKVNREAQNQKERNLLTQSPINWSKTLH